MLITAPPRNQILNSLPEQEFERLQPELRKIKVSQGEIIYRPNEPVKFVYFPEDCIVSTVTVFDDGASIENGIVGSEGLLGVSSALTTMTSPREATVQSNGECFQIPTAAFRDAFDNGNAMRHLSLSYNFAFFEQVAQAGACNKHHSVNERIARWLLTLQDRTGKNQLTLTQDFMAQMLGVHRPGVTLAAINLKEAGFIDYRRGTISILDREGLEKSSCECYRLIKRAYEQYISILEIQALNRRLDSAQSRLAHEMDRRSRIQNTTFERVRRLRGVVSEIRFGRKSQVICAKCKSVKDRDGEWFTIDNIVLEDLMNKKPEMSICENCEDLLRRKSNVTPFDSRKGNEREK